jgi:hypothetical protein
VQAPPSAPQSVGARSRQELSRLYDAVTDACQRYEQEPEWWGFSSLESVRGIAAALAWVLGRSEWAPVTGEYTPGGPDAAALRAEDYTADDAACRRRNVPGISPSFANGVQHTVMWVRGDTDDPPYAV